MAQKKNKDRKEQLLKFKQKTKKQMAEQNELAQVGEIRSYPTWKSQEKIEVSGLEWQSIYNVLNIFREGLVAAESVMQRNLEQGKIVMKYVDGNDKEISAEKVAEYTKQMQEIFEARQKQAQEVPQTETVSPILTAEGESQASVTDGGNPLKAV